MASLLLSLLEEEAKEAHRPPAKRARHNSEFPGSSSSEISATANSAAAEGSGHNPSLAASSKTAGASDSGAKKRTFITPEPAEVEASQPVQVPQTICSRKHHRRQEGSKNNHSNEKGGDRNIFFQKRDRNGHCGVSCPSTGRSRARPDGDSTPAHQHMHGRGGCAANKDIPGGPKRGDSFAALRARLPVWRFRAELQKKVKEHQVTLVVGETGSGKTTQVPQLLLQWGVCPGGWIAVSQPRRVAAVSLACRVSSEMGDAAVGGLVGYTVRFESKVSRRTRIRFMTDGMLVREALVDPKLKRFSALILDEVHERALQTDFLLGLAKMLAEQRPELKVLLMSATLETERLRQFFPNAAVVSIPGSTFPVKTLYSPDPQEDFLEAAMLAVLQIHLGGTGGGDVLVFLPGQEEIETLAAMLRSKLQLLEAFVAKHREQFGEDVEYSVRLGDEVYRHRKMQRLLVCPMYAALPFDRQQQVLLPAPPEYSRKAVLATNIAETSLTVSGIRFVVDTGLCKVKARDHRTHTEALILQEISQDSAMQRAGRAGREAPGVVYCLYTEGCYQKMQMHKTPEILSCDVSQLFLQLKVLGIENPLSFPLLDAPPHESFSSAGRQLYRLEAINDQGDVTDLGKQLAVLPLPPQLGALLLASCTLDCEEAALTLAAMLSTENVWSTPFNLSRGSAAALSKARKRFTDPLSDHLTLVGAYNHWAQASDPYAFCKEAGLQYSAMVRARAIREQLQNTLATLGGRTGYPSLRGTSLGPVTDKHDQQQQALNLRRCLAKSCWQQAARLQPKTRQFVTAVHRQTVKIYPSSVLCNATKLPQWVIYTELVHTSKTYMRCLTAIEAPWLRELAPKWFTTLRA